MISELHSSVFRNCTHSEFGIALAKVKELLKFKFFSCSFRNCTHSEICITVKIVDNSLKLWIISNIDKNANDEFGIALIR
jgi:hypothetical protein